MYFLSFSFFFSKFQERFSPWRVQDYFSFALEHFSVERCKTKTTVIPTTNSKEQKYLQEPTKTSKKKTKQTAQSAGKRE